VGAFTSLQLRPTDKLILDGGVRLQAAPALSDKSADYGLQPTFSAAAVYEFIPDWHVKVNYAEGFRPPGFNARNGNGEAVQLSGTPALEVEQSRSAQVEVNARLLKGQKRIRELDVRVDYAYTILNNYIAYIGGANANTDDRGINSAELLAKLYLKGGHRFEFGYSYNAIDTADKGIYHSVPNNWFNLSSINPLIEDTLELATIVRVYGAFEDPNRRVEARDLERDPMTGGATFGDPTQTVNVSPYETVIDRQAPAAELQIGLRWQPSEALQVSGTLYNAFSNERGAYDSFDDLEPRLEITPAQFEAFRFFANAVYTF
jgi:outer membrane receptor protein involved in Fe transport